MKDNFQIITIIVFIVAALFGILVFSGVISLGGSGAPGGQGTVILWGTFKNEVMSPLVETMNAQNPSFVLKYEEKSAETYDQDLLEALASGVGPDMFFMPDDLAFRYKDRVFALPADSYPISAFQNNFAGAGEVFLTDKGMMAFPITIDPLVMYYNRSTLDANGIVYPPEDWEEFALLTETLTKKDETNRILKSSAALGHFSNVTNAKGILSMLFMQGGNPIVTEQAGNRISTLDNYTSVYSLEPILKFYTDFADPLHPTYSWNKSLPPSRDAFSAENLAFYFGYASELSSLAARNPNQNFLVAPVPQIKGSNFKSTSARVNGIAVSAFSKNFETAFIAAGTMTSGDFAKNLSAKLGVAPARRDLLASMPNDSFSPTFYSSALFARGWLDPAPKETENIFRIMVESVLSNNRSLADALRDASAKLSVLLRK
ncbi:MAG: hypothetical protein WD991_02520 [Candidatus Paceibacterota bacterium]